MLSDFKFYTLDEIDSKDARYNLIFGERSNGKTFAVLEKIVSKWIESGCKEQGVYMRRYDEEIKGHLGSKVFEGLVASGIVDEITHGEWDSIRYYNRGWYLAKYDDELDKYIKQSTPFCFALSINNAQNYKSTAYPYVTTICFDEFITDRYMVNEYVEFSNLLSTIIRNRDDVKIYMLGNTVNRFNIYFDEMGLHNARKMQQDSIDVYKYEIDDDKQLLVAVEYTATRSSGKKSDMYFSAFGNTKLNMITTGEWETPMYPHAPFKIEDRDILDVFFIKFKGELLQGNIIVRDTSMFVFIHPKTTPIKDEDEKIIYSLTPSPLFNYTIRLDRNSQNKITTIISKLFSTNQFYYSDNDTGEIVRNYVSFSQKVGVY